MDQLTKFMTESPRDIQDPIWTRWGTTIVTEAVFLDNWSSTYFLSVGVKSYFDTKSHVWKLACTMISLMNEKAEPSLESLESLDSFVDSFTEDNMNERGCELNQLELNEGQSPTFT